MTYYDVLLPQQRTLLPLLTGTRRLGYVLYGGTAVALQLGHRQSIDFDFFSDRPLDEAAIVEAVPALQGAQTVEQAPRTWTVVVELQNDAERVKLSFFGGLRFGRVGNPTLTDNGEITMASLSDLMGHKLKVILQRVEAKDYMDVSAMLRAGHSLEAGLGAAQALFANFAPAEALRALTYFEGGDLSRVAARDRQQLLNAAGRVTSIPDMPILSQQLG